jgi:2,3-dihydroxybenzoate decarboxylase
MEYIALEEAFDIPELAARRSAPPGAGMRFRRSFLTEVLPRLTDFTQYRLPDMDAHNVAVQVVSLTVPGIQDPGLSSQQAVDEARFANDYLAEMIAAHPDRFRGFAALAMQDPARAVEELTRCVGEHGFVGALVNDNTQGHYLDEAQYEEFWSALESLDVPLYIHPGGPPADHWHVLEGCPELYGATWSWAAETAAHALRIVFSGVFDRHPGATVILGHMGEFLPFQTSRLDSRYLIIETDSPLQRMPSEYIGSNIRITTSGVFAPAALTGAVLAIGADAIMFSIDYPYENTQEAVTGFERTTLSPADREKIAYKNAAALLRI